MRLLIGFERACDAIVFGALIVVAIHTDSGSLRAVVLFAAAMVVLGWFIAWHRAGAPTKHED